MIVIPRQSSRTLSNVSFTAANQVAQQMNQMNPGAGMFGANTDPEKAFAAEAENLEVVEHKPIYDGIEERLLLKLGA